MLRVTDKMGYLATQTDLTHRQQELAHSQRAATTGLRVERASDDPVAAAQLERTDAYLMMVEQCQSNIGRAQSELGAADTALGDATELLIRARELALAMANGTVGAEERATAAAEIDGLREQLIGLANTQHDGRHLFGGYRTDLPPVDSTGAVVGDPRERRVLASPDQVVEVSIGAAEAFAPGGGRDLFSDLDALAAALRADDAGAISQSAGHLKAGISQLTAARGKVGVYHARLDRLSAALESRSLTSTQERTELAEVDPVEAFSALARAQQALNAALQVSARVLDKLTLVDKL